VILTAVPERPQVGVATTLRFALTDDDGLPIENLMTHHDRKLHVVLVSEDMQVFGHIHPEDFDEPIGNGEASVHFTFPRAGRYLAAADLATETGSYAEQFILTVEGDTAVPESAASASASLVVVEADEGDSYTAPVVLDAPGPTGGYELSVARPGTITAGAPATFTWRLTKDGKPITDLRPFLAAAMHLAVVKDDFGHFVHAHGTAKGLGTGYDHVHGASSADDDSPEPGDLVYFGPEIVATVTFPEPGRYFLFGQAAHGETLLITRLPIDVR